MSVIDTIQSNVEGIIFVRIAKHTNGVFAGWHRTSIQPGDDSNKIISAVNADLVRLGHDTLIDISILTTEIATVQTPSVVQTFQQAQAAANAKLNAKIGNVTIA